MQAIPHIVVTGGAGFIGSHLCETLLEKGYAVTAIDNLVTGQKSNLHKALTHKNFRFFQWDVSQALPEIQKTDELQLIANHGITAVLHLACPASPADFDRIPFEIMKVDSIGTMNTVELAEKYGARYVVASTSEIYGDPLVHPQKETYWGNVNSVGPRAVYDEAKRFSEAYVSARTRLKGLNGGMVRIFNTYGPRNRPDDGRVVPEFCVKGIRGEPIPVHGGGTQTRSFCYVTDLVDGIIRYFESTVHEPVNLGNPIERTILEFAQLTQKLTGGRSSIIHLPARPEDPSRRCPDITRAREWLQWEPKISIEEGLARTIEHFRGLST